MNNQRKVIPLIVRVKNLLVNRVFPAVTLLLALSNLALAANAKCSNADLKGDYGFTISGERIDSNGITFTHGIAMTNFDGKGNLTQVDFVTFNGVLAPGLTDPDTGFNTAESGTYHVNPDCTGRAEIHFLPPPGVSSGLVVKLTFVLTNQGRAIHTVVAGEIFPGTTQLVPISARSDGFKLDSGDR